MEKKPRIWASNHTIWPLLDPGMTLGHPLRPKPPKSARLCASVIKYLCQAALKQNYSCVSVTPTFLKDRGWVLAISVTHTTFRSVLCPELYTNLCLLLLPLSPQPTEQRSPQGSWSEAICSSSSPLFHPGLAWPGCTSDREKWLLITPE